MIDYLFLDYLIVLARKQNDYVNQAFNEIMLNMIKHFRIK